LHARRNISTHQAINSGPIHETAFLEIKPLYELLVITMKRLVMK